MYDAETLAALQSGALVLRDLFWLAGWDSDGDPAEFGFWTGEDNITINVIAGSTGATVSRDYIGGGTLLGVPAIVDTVGVEAQAAQFVLSQIEEHVVDMVRGNRIRGARVELQRALLDPATWQPVSEPFPRFIGQVGTAQIVTAEAGGQGRIVLNCNDDRLDLTRTNPALKSDETQKALHSGDRFRRYDVAGQVEVWWGQQRGAA